MKLKSWCQAIFAFILTSFGGFWFLQGISVLDVCPILCFADCACIEGGSAVWSLIGAASFLAGCVCAASVLKRR
jgi:hypothetical protein